MATRRSGDKLIVTTNFPGHRAFPYVLRLGRTTDLYIEYRVRVRATRLIVDHGIGDVHVDDVAGNIDVRSRQGLVAIGLAGDAPRSIDAKTDAGSVISDFSGRQGRRPWLIGKQFNQEAPASAQNIHFRVGYGDIFILRARNAQSPPPAIEK